MPKLSAIPRTIRKLVYNGLFYCTNCLFMYKYNGLLVHESHDDDGILEVVDNQGVRCLHFGSSAIQSSMSLSDPGCLQLAYARAMTACLLFMPHFADSALLVGLGGGSMVKFFLENFPDSRLQVIEYRKNVVKIARSHFALPIDARLKIIVGEGSVALRQRALNTPQSYGLLFIDAFDHEGMAQSLRSQAFFDDCQAVLKADGMMVMNLWGGMHEPDFLQCAHWLGTAFNWRVLFLPVKDRSNIIGLAFNADVPVFDYKQLKPLAESLEYRYHIEYPVYLQALKRHNASTFSTLFKS